MRDKDLYARILKIEDPWRVAAVELNLEQGRGGRACGARRRGAEPARSADSRRGATTRVDGAGVIWIRASTARFWLPRCRGVHCERHKVKQVAAPWSESRSRFTAPFEAVVIDWLREAAISAVAQQMGLSWDEVDGIMQRAVQRGLERREVRSSRAHRRG